MPNLEIDHFAISCARLADGVAYVEDTLGVKMGAIGYHPKMGTHNRLLSLGPSIYLEVIAIDPDATSPNYPRWFDLDGFAGTPRVTNWICRTGDLSGCLAKSPANTGEPMAFERNAFRWDMAVPKDGKLPFSGGFPALIQWHGDAHPAPLLDDTDVRLKSLRVFNPDAAACAAALEPLGGDKLAEFVKGEVGFELELATPSGTKVLR
ncbi:VOC family protein [Falsihalocynthiibacter sp. SS001]|uniref:VOC family protein n=1 Tax=Falsihalocynthiibacter sp. SS001 TaxID=3349698 RepID=UPI0036D26334